MSIVGIKAVNLTRSGERRTSRTRQPAIEQHSGARKIRTWSEQAKGSLAGNARGVGGMGRSSDSQQVEYKVSRLGDDVRWDVLELELECKFSNRHSS